MADLKIEMDGWRAEGEGEKGKHKKQGKLLQRMNKCALCIWFQYYWFDMKAIRLFKYLVEMKDMTIKDSKVTASEDPDPRPAEKTELSPTFKTSCHPRPSKLISKRCRLLRIRSRRASKTHQHDISSASQNSNLLPNAESTTKIQTEFCSNVRSQIQNQNFMAQPFPSAQVGNGQFKFDFQRSEIDPFLPQIREHMILQQPLYIPRETEGIDERTEANRSKLCTWLFQVSARYNFRGQTGFLAVNIVDRVSGLRKLRVDDLPLVGVTALFMAAKYEEIKVPVAEDFVRLLSSSYKITKQAILKMQSTLLLLLDFRMSYASPLIFISDQAAQMNLPTPALERAHALAQEFIIQSPARYWTPSRLASYCIQTAIEEFV